MNIKNYRHELTRKDGFIDLDDYFSPIMHKKNFSEAELYMIGVIDTEETGFFEKFWFYLNGEHTLYKIFPQPSYGAHAELISEEIAIDMGVPCAHYDLAVWQNRTGVVTQDIKKFGETMIPGIVLIEDFFADCIADDDAMRTLYGVGSLEYDDVVNKLNNLEVIWSALDYHYKDNPNRGEIVAKLMTQLVDVMVFDAIALQKDRHCGNWSIIEGKDEPRIAAIYDNSHIGLLNHKRDKSGHIIKKDPAPVVMRLAPTEELIESKPLKLIKEFVNMSDDMYRERIAMQLDKVSNGIDTVIERVEKRTGAVIPTVVKNEYLTAVTTNIESIKEIIHNKHK